MKLTTMPQSPRYAVATPLCAAFVVDRDRRAAAVADRARRLAPTTAELWGGAVLIDGSPLARSSAPTGILMV